ncbi:hypothetical protein VOI54_15025 [Tamlana sp. 2201CG12-4]|uniref:Spy/CpxP family protein refolding chaperone n=1 Tax=Tamlana sp. 2201CG12-4 TaxID=3112582 RepID=UPI002DB93CC4|nr:hypothetical protein [Tamlana sp. 2201CG12-4]MEC3908341.1 hypothetical protein [Tamlana sp. 2201CG12-4]
MKKHSLLYILLIFLVIVNVFFLYNYLGNGNNRSKGPQPPGDFLVKELGFSASQLEEFRGINQKHHHRMRSISEDIRELKDALFNGLSDVTDNEFVIDSITTLIGKKEKEKDLETFNHFRHIQELCNEKQKEKFNDIVKDALRKGIREQRPPHERHDGHRPPPPLKNREGHRPQPKH